jgi:hypothetical protein
MSDNKNIQDKKDRIKVDSGDASEVEYLHSQHPHLEHQQVADAVKKYGPYRDDIEKYLASIKK